MVSGRTSKKPIKLLRHYSLTCKIYRPALWVTNPNMKTVSSKKKIENFKTMAGAFDL